MNVDQIQNSFSAAIADSVKLFPEGVDRYQIFTPFHFDDGDHFVITLQKSTGGGWIITDEGHTYMHMSYDMDLSLLEHGTRNTIIEGALEKYGIEEKKGRIFARVDDFKNAGSVFYNFIQGLIHITDVSYLNRKRVISTFKEDFEKLIYGIVKTNRIHFNYHDESRDPAKKYPVDYRINGISRPIHIYAIKNDGKCRDATIGILQFEKWGVPCSTMGIFEDQKKINRAVLSRFTDVCECHFSSLAEKREQILEYLGQQIG